MRKSTINLVVGILIGMFITGISDSVSGPRNKISSTTPAATSVSLPIKDPNVTRTASPEIAPGLQIVEVPPPLNLNGLHPYQCYLNGQPVTIPKDVIKGLLANHTDTSEKDPNFNVHNFTGNLKMIDRPVGSTVPTSPFPVTGRVR